MEDNGGRDVAAVGAVVPRVGPEPAGLGPATSGIKHRQRRVIGEDAVGRHYVGDQPLVQRLEPPAGGPDPARQGGAADLQPVPGKDPALAIQRQVAAVAADQHVGDQSWGGETAGQYPVRGWCLMQGTAAAAGLLWPGDADNPDLRRDPVQHLAAGGAGIVRSATAVRTAVVWDRDDGLDTRQMGWQRCPMRGFGRRLQSGISRGWRHGRRSSRLCPGKIGLQLLEPEGHLVGIEALGAASEPRTLELLDDQAQPVDLDLSLVQCRRHVAHQLLQHGGVGWQAVERDPHERRLPIRRRTVHRKPPQPAIISRRVCTGARHSRPSSSIDIAPASASPRRCRLPAAACWAR